MKIQDGGFFLVLVILLFLRRPKFFLIAGLGCWILAIPLFATWTFFTGERLTWYGAAFVFAFLLFSFIGRDKVQ